LLHHYNKSKYQTNHDPKTLWNLLGISLLRQEYYLPEWEEFAPMKSFNLADLEKNKPTERAVIESIPDWMDRQATKNIDAEVWGRELAAMNKQADVFLRVNTLATTHKELQESLKKEGIETVVVKNVPSALRVTLRKNLFSTKAFKSGWFEVQDAGSQQIPPFLQVAPGMRVIDACAGAGGKSLQLATLMNNKGSLIAMDIHEWKLKELKLRARRNGIHNIEGRAIESSKVIKRLAEKADRLLLDVPCSGLGVLRRNPDSKWKMKPEFLQEVVKTQNDILFSYSKMLKPGGKMVYATCSILPIENENQVQKFLAANPNFTLEEEKHISPAKSGFDGFYMARLAKGQ